MTALPILAEVNRHAVQRARWHAVPGCSSRSTSESGDAVSRLIPHRARSSEGRSFAVERVDRDAPTTPLRLATEIAPVEGKLIIDLRTDPPTLIVDEVESQPLPSDAPPWYERTVVRLLDLVVALPAFLLAVPLMLLLMIAVRLDSPGPALFSSRRITRDGRTFNMWKLRTMRLEGNQILEAHFRDHPEDAEFFAARMKLENDPRVTGLGRFLRRWSLDELPQLLNVILGHMSIVGPRPLLAEEAERMGRAYATVVRVKGGLTGLWQVSGRNMLTFEQRVPLDVAYVNERTLRKDLRIIGITVVQFFRGSPGAF